MAIFHSYVSLPEGIRNEVSGDCETSAKIYAIFWGNEDPLKSYSYFDVNARHRSFVP